MHSVQSRADLVRTGRRWVKSRTRRTPGVSSSLALDIGQMISPLRLDVLVRASIFEAWAADWDHFRTRPDDALELAQSHAYRIWFDSIADERIRRTYGESSADEAFAWRVRRSHRLLGRFIDDGFDKRQPITVKLHRGGTTPNGKVMGPRIYPVDGCHRLALLWANGTRELAPALYRLLPTESATQDNTTLLLNELDLSPEDYYSFIGHGYGIPEAGSANELTTAIGESDPRHEELVSVLAADQKVIDARAQRLRKPPEEQ